MTDSDPHEKIDETLVQEKRDAAIQSLHEQIDQQVIEYLRDGHDGVDLVHTDLLEAAPPVREALRLRGPYVNPWNGEPPELDEYGERLEERVLRVERIDGDEGREWLERMELPDHIDE